MNPHLLEEVEALRLKLDKAPEMTPELRHEYAVTMASLRASIEAYHGFSASLDRIKKGFSHETDELCVMESFLKQTLKGKP